MSAHAQTAALVPGRARLVHRARLLSWLSIGWMGIEAGVATVAALVAGSVALLGFGLDSFIELTSASIILWRFSGARVRSEAAERRAQRLVAACFGVLALYLVYDGVRTLVDASRPDVSWAGAAVSAGAIVVMPLLARQKARVATQLRSLAVAGDAAQSWLCALAAAGTLASIVANAAAGWWWLDPVVGLCIAGLAVKEGRDVWSGEGCSDCAPIGFAPTDATDCPREAASPGSA